MSNFGDHPAGFFGDSSFYNGVATTSARFDDGSSAYLTRTPDEASNRRTFTWSGWVKRCSPATTNVVFSSYVDSSNFFAIRLRADGDNGRLEVMNYSSGNDLNLTTTQVIRDVSAWYNIVVAIDTTQGTNTNRAKVYINGSQVTDFSIATYPSENFDTDVNIVDAHYVGSLAAGNYHDGYLSDVNFIDGLALTPSSFGETKNGVWIPINTSGLTFGTNGFRLQFAQVGVGTASTSTIGADTSGNTHHFTSSGIVASDCAMPDSPENNFNTQNPLSKQTYTFAEGNLKLSRANGTGQSATIGTISVPSGKWYWEVKLISGQSNYPRIGIFNTNLGNNHLETKYPANNDLGARVWGSGANGATNKIFGDSNAEAAFGSYDDGDVVQFALDMDNFKMYMGKNDTWYTNSSTTTDKANISDSSANAAFDAASNLDIVAGNSFTPCIFSNANADVWIANFGQDSTFAGAVSAGGNADSNDIGDFAYEPPSDFLSLCTANMSEPTIGPNSTTQSDNHFDVVLYTGNSSDKTISGLGFQPDWVWSKSRSLAQNHHIHDSARGVELRLNAEANNAEISDGELKTFTSDGFTFDTAGATNTNNATNVAWCWHANSGTATATISESGDNPAAVVQANPTAGFSLITYTGTGDTGTIAHGLGAVPTWILIKNRDQADSWAVYHGGNTAAPETDYLVLDTNAATADGVGWWDDTAPTSSVFTVHDQHMVNADGEKYVAYVFADVEGYSKMGSYISNGNVDGTFIYLGFRPKFVIVKRTNATYSWMMYDTERDPSNVMNTTFFADLNNAESASDNIDFVSNGIKLRTTGNSFNGGSGSLFVYMAFAEAPFKYANAR